MEKLMLSPSSCLGNVRVKKCAVTSAGNLPLRNSSNINSFNSKRVLGFKASRIQSQTGFFGERVNLRAGGWRYDNLCRNFLAPATPREELGPTDLQVEENIGEDRKGIDGVHEDATWNGESKGLENPDTELFHSLRSSIEELNREVENAKESLADISKEATGKDDVKPLMTESEPIQERRKAAKIHDFCFGIPYGGILIGLGLVGLLVRGGLNSGLCLITGISVLLLSLTSLKVWRQGQSCSPFIIRQAAFSLFLLAGHLREFYFVSTLVEVPQSKVIALLQDGAAVIFKEDLQANFLLKNFKDMLTQEEIPGLIELAEKQCQIDREELLKERDRQERIKEGPVVITDWEQEALLIANNYTLTNPTPTHEDAWIWTKDCDLTGNDLNLLLPPVRTSATQENWCVEEEELLFGEATASKKDTWITIQEQKYEVVF